MEFSIDHSKPLSLDELERFVNHPDAKVKLSEGSKASIRHCREYLDAKLKNSTQAIYGINTGFGSLCNVIIPESDIEKLQENLVKSHACGTGEEVPDELVRLMLFLKVQSLAYGKSGVQMETAERLCDFINHGLLPVVYKQGSLGASGDLAPLAHLCLPLLGLGKIRYAGKVYEASDVLKQKGLGTIRLRSKEGLALLNGTQFMSAYGVYCLIRARKLSAASDYIAALSIDAFDARLDPFDEKLHHIRPHPGQIETAVRIRHLLHNSEISAKEKSQVQDPYSFRCVPQVHGASKDALHYVQTVFETEINSVTDNPTVFPESDEVLSGGNFHGQALALGFDFLCIAMAELANIAERRTYLLISGQRGLPAFLSPEPGLNSGFMIPQYTAASLVSQNKQLCTPASVDSIVSSNGQEDHVSMGANAAVKCLQVIRNCEQVLGIELFTAAQALEFRRPRRSSAPIEALLEEYRKTVPFLQKDEVMHEHLMNSGDFIRRYAF
ncbi:MAG TPA: histidine ammonia-lyase [Bacteroidia bacterium]|nr:histidine ammonia-lyase [Bacteroidia bacterium]